MAEAVWANQRSEVFPFKINNYLQNSRLCHRDSCLQLCFLPVYCSGWVFHPAEEIRMCLRCVPAHYLVLLYCWVCAFSISLTVWMSTNQEVSWAVSCQLILNFVGLNAMWNKGHKSPGRQLSLSDVIGMEAKIKQHRCDFLAYIAFRKRFTCHGCWAGRIQN